MDSQHLLLDHHHHMFRTHNAFLDVSHSSSPISGFPRSRHRPPVPSLFTNTGDREDPSDSHHHYHHLSSRHHPSDLSDMDFNVSQQFLPPGDSLHNITSSSAPENPTYDDLPPLSPIFPTLDQGSMSVSPAAMFLSAFSPSVSLAPLPDDEGEEVDGYRLGSIVGYGGFSTIRRAFSPSGGSVAVKIVRRSDLASQTDSSQARDRLENEATIWKTLSHEHILPLFHLVQTSYADFFFMLLCPAGTLYDILKRDGRPALPLDDTGTMFRQVARGVRYLHEQMGLVHADLKLENVLVDEMGVCRIGDFGMTRRIGEEIEDDPATAQPGSHARRNQSSVADSFRSLRQSALSRGPGSLRTTAHLSLLHHNNSRPRRRESTPVSTQSSNQAPHPHAVYDFPPGSLPYAAPELLRTPDTENPYRPNPAQDIWALGVMLYALLTGGLPFVDSFEPRLTMKILHGSSPPSGPFQKRMLTKLSLRCL
jgi:MAP/microtubule affinity-regulating kinase